MTGRGVELNPVLRSLLEVSPFLAIPYLASLLLPILVFEFAHLVQFSIQISLAINFAMASINNIGTVIFHNSFVVNFYATIFGDWLSVEKMAFTVGLLVICVFKILTFESDKQSLRRMFLQSSGLILLYIGCYLLISMIPLIWSSL